MKLRLKAALYALLGYGVVSGVRFEVNPELLRESMDGDIVLSPLRGQRLLLINNVAPSIWKRR